MVPSNGDELAMELSDRHSVLGDSFQGLALCIFVSHLVRALVTEGTGRAFF